MRKTRLKWVHTHSHYLVLASRTPLYNQSICSHLKLRAKHFYFLVGHSETHCDWTFFSIASIHSKWYSGKSDDDDDNHNQQHCQKIWLLFYLFGYQKRWKMNRTLREQYFELNLFGSFDQKRICKTHHIAITSFTKRKIQQFGVFIIMMIYLMLRLIFGSLSFAHFCWFSLSSSSLILSGGVCVCFVLFISLDIHRILNESALQSLDVKICTLLA